MALLVVAGLLYFLLPTTRDRVTVRVARVERTTVVNNVSTNGRVEPLVDFQPHAAAPSTVEQLFIHLGEKVHQGQAVATLDTADAAARAATAKTSLQTASQDVQNLSSGGTHDELLGERAELTNAQSELEAATANLGALQRLQRQGAASASEVAAAQQRLNTAQAKIDQLQTRLQGRYSSGDLATAHARYTQARAELAAAQSTLSGLALRSPITGTVYSLPVMRFQYVNAGEALLSIADLSKLQVRAFFDEPEIGSLKAGEPVRIEWNAKPDHVWHGHVTQAPTTITNVGSRNVGECLISVDDAQDDLLPNTNVTVTVTTLQHPDVLSLPREALHTEGANKFVYRVIGDKLVRTSVSVGVVTLTRVEITGGLKQGDVVALGPTTEVELRNDLPVRVQP